MAICIERIKRVLDNWRTKHGDRVSYKLDSRTIFLTETIIGSGRFEFVIQVVEGVDVYITVKLANRLIGTDSALKKGYEQLMVLSEKIGIYFILDEDTRTLAARIDFKCSTNLETLDQDLYDNLSRISDALETHYDEWFGAFCDWGIGLEHE